MLDFTGLQVLGLVCWPWVRFLRAEASDGQSESKKVGLVVDDTMLCPVGLDVGPDPSVLHERAVASAEDTEAEPTHTLLRGIIG